MALIGALLMGIIAPSGVVVSSKAGAQGKVRTILAFPAVDESAEGDLGDVASRLTSRLALAAQDVTEIDLEVFSEASPMVRRGIADGALRRSDVEGPKDSYVAVLIGKAMGLDSVVLLSVQNLTVGGDPRTADVSVMGTEYSVAANVEAGAVVDEPTGNTFGVSGTAKAKDRAGGDDGALSRSAARDAAYKVLSVLSDVPADIFEKVGAKPKKSSHKWKYIVLGLLAIGIVVATTGGSNNAAPAGGVAAHVPTQLTVSPRPPDSMRLRWVRPATGDTILKYQIQRSENGGPFIRIDGDSLDGNATQFLDYNITAGATYVYQIKVLYTSGQQTAWQTFLQVGAP